MTEEAKNPSETSGSESLAADGSEVFLHVGDRIEINNAIKWSSCPIPNLMEIDIENTREIVIKNACCEGMSHAPAKP